MSEANFSVKSAVWDGTASLQDTLNALIQELQSPTARDKKKSMDCLLQLLQELVEKGMCLMDALGQHVCCNIMALLTQHFVKPALQKPARAMASVRTDVTRPFLDLLETLHKNVPSNFLHQPFMWKEAKPLHLLFKHIVEVLQGDSTSSLCGHDYSAILAMLLRIDVYRSNITKRTVEELTLRLLDLMVEGTKDMRGGTLTGSSLEQVARALTALTTCPHFFESLTHPTEVMKKLTDVTVLRHHSVDLTNPLMIEMHLISAINGFVARAQHDDKATATLPLRLVKITMDAWHQTNRRDGWRLEVVRFVQVQLALVFSDVICDELHQKMGTTTNSSDMRDAKGSAAASPMDSAGEGSPAASGGPPPRLVPYIELVHNHLLPATLSLLSSRFEFGVVMSRELAHAPCEKLQGLFDMCSIVFMLALRTYRWFATINSGGEPHPAVKEARDDDNGDRDVPATKKHRSSASPFHDILSHIEHFLTFSNSSAMDARKDSCCMWLHALAVPMTALCLDQLQCTQLSEVLMRLVGLGAFFEQPLLAALLTLAPRASHTMRAEVFSWALTKYVAPSGIDADDGMPNQLGYELLARLTEVTLLEQLELRQCQKNVGPEVSLSAACQLPLSPGVAERFLISSAFSKSAHFSVACGHKNFSLSVCRLLLRQVQLAFLLDDENDNTVIAPDGLLGHCLRVAANNSLSDVELDSVKDTVCQIARISEGVAIAALRRQGGANPTADEVESAMEHSQLQLLRGHVAMWLWNQPSTVVETCRPDAVLFVTPQRMEAAMSFSHVGMKVNQNGTSNAVSKVSKFLSGLGDNPLVSFLAQTLFDVYLALDRSAAQTEAPQAVSVAARATQLVHIALHLKGSGLWDAPSDEEEGKAVAEKLAVRNADMTPIMEQLSSNGKVAFAVQLLLTLVASRVARMPLRFVGEDKFVVAFASLLGNCGNLLCSVQLCFWEPSQRILSSLGLIARKVMDDGVIPLSQWQPVTAHDHDLVPKYLVLLEASCDVVRHLCFTLRTTDIFLSASDPLINAQGVLTALKKALASPALLLHQQGDERAVGRPHLSKYMLQACERLLTTLVVLSSDEAHRVVLDALETLYLRHAHTHTDCILHIVSSFGRETSPALNATFRNDIGAFCEKVVTQLRSNDVGGALASTPILTPTRHIAMVRCLAQLFTKCESAQAERLAKLFFQFCSVKYSFAVRMEAAEHVSVPFRSFTRVINVLQELQYTCKDSIMSKERATCTTGLLALCNSCSSAPQLEPEIVSFLLEFYSTRDFHHKPLILQALHRIAHCSASSFSQYVELTRHHAFRLTYDWLWRFAHPLQAIPCLCFGYDTLYEMASSECPLLLPIALLHLRGSGSEIVVAGCGPLDVLLEVFSTNGKRIEATSLIKEYFSDTVATLMLFSECYSTVAGSTTNSNSILHQQLRTLSTAAAFALEWIAIQLGSETYRDFCKRHADGIVSAMLTRSCQGCGAYMLSEDNCSEIASCSSVPGLPSVSFAVASKAVGQLCTKIGCSTIGKCFSLYKGDRASFVLWELYADYVRAPTPSSRCDALHLLKEVIYGWLPQCLALRHVLESVLHILCHILQGVYAPLSTAAARATVCDLLRSVWNSASVVEEQKSVQLLAPFHAFVSSTLLSTSSQFTEARALWSELSAKNGNLQRADWHHQQSQLVASLSQGDLQLSHDDESPGLPQPSGVTESKQSIINTLQDLMLISGSPAPVFYHDIANVVDRETAIIEKFVADNPVHHLKIISSAAMHFLHQSTSEVSVDVRIAAADAFRAVYNAGIKCRKSLAKADDFCVLPEGAALQRESLIYCFPQRSLASTMASIFIRSGSVDEVLDVAFGEILTSVRQLSFHHDPAIANKAADACRMVMTSIHDVMERAKKQLHTSDPDALESLTPFARDHLPQTSSPSAAAGATRVRSARRTVSQAEDLQRQEHEPLSITSPLLWDLVIPSATVGEPRNRQRRSYGSANDSDRLFIGAFLASLAHKYKLTTRFDFLVPLLDLAKHHSAFAEPMLPVVLLLALMNEDTETLKRQRKEWSTLLLDKVLSKAKDCKYIARQFLSSISMIRCAITSSLKRHGCRSKGTVKSAAGSIPTVQSTKHMWWLSDISALDIAVAAKECEEMFMCLQFLELSCEGLAVSSRKNGGLSLLCDTLGMQRTAHVTSRVTGIDGVVSETTSRVVTLIPFPESNKRILKGAAQEMADSRKIQEQRELVLPIVMCAAMAFHDEDLVKAASSRAAMPSNRMRQMHETILGNWSQALTEQDRCHYEEASDESLADTVRCLVRLGCTSTAVALSSRICNSGCEGKVRGSSRRMSSTVRSAIAEAAWKSAQWDVELHGDSNSSYIVRDASFVAHESLLAALRAVHNKDPPTLRVALRSGRLQMLSLLSHPMSVFSALIQLQALKDIETFFAKTVGGKKSTSLGWDNVVAASSFFDALDSVPYEQCEVLDSVRDVLSCLSRDFHLWSRHVIGSVERATEGNLLAVAERRLYHFVDNVMSACDGKYEKLAKLPSLLIAEGKLLRRKGDLPSAVRCLQGVELAPNSSPNTEITRLIVEWASEAQLVSVNSLVEDKAFHEVLLQSRDDDGKASYLMGTLCEAALNEFVTQWENCSVQRNSREETEKLLAQLEQQRKPLVAKKKACTLTKEEEPILEALTRRTNGLSAEMASLRRHCEKIVKDCQTYRSTALSHLARSLNLQKSFDGNNKRSVQAIFRFVRVWLNPPSIFQFALTADRDPIARVPSHRFLPLFTQLVARLTTSDNPLLRDVVMRVANDHPFHTLWSLFAFANGDRWTEAEATTHTTDSNRILVAKNIINQIAAANLALAGVVQQVQSYIEALLELAFERVPKASVFVNIKPNSKLLQPCTFDKVPLPTLPLPVDPTSAARGYSLSRNTPTIAHYRPSYEVMGGVNRPKALQCTTSIGTTEKQLLKSNDDMRQDAIIEQVFRVVNTLLADSEDRSAARRKLQIRTYQCVPLAPSSGVIQWVDDTVPIGAYLVGSLNDPTPEAAHNRYFPDEPTYVDCWQEFTKEKLTGAVREEVFRKVCSQVTPAMHYFFYEMFASPQEWVERKRDYCQSVAAASMVGYLVGLGDRHLNNILISVKTADIVLIDLGIAFDQGKCLSVPEIVPFRLTRDVVDGMGIFGVEGTFRSSCEATLRVARANKELLEVLLEVFIHDPLARWAVDPMKAREGGARSTLRQSSSDADRTLSRVKEKLCGYEKGEVFGVEGQVQRLILDATNESHLAAMFHGWSAWV